MTKPSIPQGTRDFGPDVVHKRNYILNTIKSVFELYGFQPLETPAMENIETLMGKYGDEGDKLIYRVLDSGNPFTAEFFKGLAECLKDYFNSTERFIEAEGRGENPWGNPLWKLNPEVLEQLSESLIKNSEWREHYLPKLKNETSGKALKYDLTIPFARYVAMNHNQLTFPFKRYQIQPVWRADRPQKGRYREFYQCDADVVGSNSLLNEIELANIYHDVFTQLGITGYELKINHRKILTALAELCGGADKMTDIAVAIDKLDKIGMEKVKEELMQKKLSGQSLQLIENYLSLTGSNAEKLLQLQKLFENSSIGKKGIDELKYLVDSGLTTDGSRLSLDLTLARGLNYYTGVIFEVKPPPESNMGSIGGGGRYDDLTGLFGVPGIPGTGISFGVDRIYDVMEEMNLFPVSVGVSTRVLFFNLGEKESRAAFPLVQQLRAKNIAVELFHEADKPAKQFKYAEKKNIPYVVIIESDDLSKNTCTVKNIITGVKQTLSQIELVKYPFEPG